MPIRLKHVDYIVLSILSILSLFPAFIKDTVTYPLAFIVFVLPGYITLKTTLSKKPDSSSEFLLMSIGLSFVIDLAFLLLCWLLGDLNLSYITTVAFTILLFCIGKIRKKSFFNYEMKQTKPLMILFLILVAYYMIVLSRGEIYLRHPDEYTYFSWIRTITEQKNIFSLNTISGRAGFEASTHPILMAQDFSGEMMRIAFIYTYVYFFTIVGVGFYQATLMSIFITCLFVFSVYTLGETVRDRSTGLLASLFVIANPAIWIFSNRLLNDIMASTFITISFIFFYKAYCKNLKLWDVFFGFLMSILAIFTNPTSLPILAVVCLLGIYRLIAIKRTGNFTTNKVILCIFPLVLAITVFTFWVFRDLYLAGLGYNVDPIYNILFRSVGIFDKDWSYFLFRDPIGAYGTWLYPMIFTFPVMLLMIDGMVNQSTRKKYLQFLLAIVIYLWIMSAAKGEVRRIFPIFPFLFIYATMASRKSSRWSLLMIPAFIFLLFVPFKGYVPYFQDPSGSSIGDGVFFFSAYAAGVVLILKLVPLLNGVWLKVNRSEKGIHTNTLQQNTIGILLIMLLCASAGFYTSYSITTHSINQAVNETLSVYELGIPQTAGWIETNVPRGSTIMTNMLFELPAYLGTDYKYLEPVGNYRYSSENLTMTFLQQVDEADYVVVFKEGRFDSWFPYFNMFFNSPPPGLTKVHEENDSSEKIVSTIYKCQTQRIEVLSLLNSSWSIVSPEGSLDNLSFQESLLVYNASNAGGPRKIVFNPTSTFDLSSSDYVAFWVYSFKQTFISLEISSPPSITYYYGWQVALQPGWNLVTIALNNPSSVGDPIDLGNIDEIRIYAKPGTMLMIDLNKGLIIW